VTLDREWDDQLPDEDAEQSTLFGADEDFAANWQHWKGMPEFSQDDMQPYATVTMKFANRKDLAAFEELIGQRISLSSSRGYWYPKPDIARFIDKRYRSITEEKAE